VALAWRFPAVVFFLDVLRFSTFLPCGRTVDLRSLFVPLRVCLFAFALLEHHWNCGFHQTETTMKSAALCTLLALSTTPTATPLSVRLRIHYAPLACPCTHFPARCYAHWTLFVTYRLRFFALISLPPCIAAYARNALLPACLCVVFGAVAACSGRGFNLLAGSLSVWRLVWLWRARTLRITPQALATLVA